ncbi:MAG: ThiF family adenylyltransferase [Candidatus Micrarchaeia archaeon]
MPRQPNYRESFSRNYPTLSKRQQEKIRRARVAVVGLGGLGGAAFETLVRLGFENLLVLDCDSVEESNLNRQRLSSLRSMGVKKAKAAAILAKSINPSCNVRSIHGKIEGKNAPIVAAWADIVLDCLDNPSSRRALHLACEKEGAPCVFGSASGAYGMASVFSKKGFAKAFSRILPAKMPEGCTGDGWKCASVIATAPNVIGTLQAQLALNALLKKPVPRAPQFLIFDGFSPMIFRLVRI